MVWPRSGTYGCGLLYCQSLRLKFCFELDVGHVSIYISVYVISNTTKDIIIINMEYLRNKSWKPTCVLSFNMDISISISILSRARGEG